MSPFPAKETLALSGALFGSAVSNVSWTTHANAVVGILAGVCSLVSVWWFVQSQRATTRLRLAEARHEELRICRECAAGHIPDKCPLANGEIPYSCPFLVVKKITQRISGGISAAPDAP